MTIPRRTFALALPAAFGPLVARRVAPRTASPSTIDTRLPGPFVSKQEGTPMTTTDTDANKALVLEFVALFNKGEVEAAVDRYYAQDIVFHDAPSLGRAGVVQIGAMMRAAFPDLVHTIDD